MIHLSLTGLIAFIGANCLPADPQTGTPFLLNSLSDDGDTVYVHRFGSKRPLQLQLLPNGKF